MFSISKPDGHWFHKNMVKISHFSHGLFPIRARYAMEKSDNLVLIFSPLRQSWSWSIITLLISDHPLVFYKGTAPDLNLEPALQHYKFIIMANVSIENRLNLYSNYLDDPQNVNIDYQMNVVMRINKYLTANVRLQTIWWHVQAVQVREIFGIGANYGF
jgi:hypothetical protein